MSAVLTPAVGLPAPWRRALPPLAALLLAVLALYHGSFAAMVKIWQRSDTFAHAFLVPPIVGWLIWRKRAALAPLRPRPWPWALLPMLLAAAAWMLGDLVGVNSLTQLAGTALLVLVVPAVLGLAVTRVLLFPLAFLFFMVPVGDFLLPVMMAWTADFTVFAVRASGVPVYREGLQFIIPSGAWSVVEACSGVRYLIASAMVGTLFAYLNYRSLRRRLLFCAVAVLVPILANWLRAYMIVMLGHLSDNRIAVGVDHLIYGWVFFGVVILLMFFIGSRWAEHPAPEQPAAPDAAPPAAAVAPAWAVAALACLILAAPQLLHSQTVAGPAAAPLAAGLLLPELPTAPAQAAAQPPLQPIFVGATAQADRAYAAADGEVVHVHVAYYRNQGYGRKLVNSQNVLVKSMGRVWNHNSGPQVGVDVAGRRVELRSAELLSPNQSGPRRRIEVRRVYWVDGRLTDNDHLAVALGALGRIAGRGDDGAMLTFYTEGPAERTAPRLDGFVAAHLDQFARQLAVARAAR